MSLSLLFSRRIICGWIKTYSTASSEIVKETIDDFSSLSPLLDPRPTHPHTVTPTTPHTSEEHIVSLADQCFMKVAIIGTPNAGKSTLVNELIGRKVFAVSPKRHTTLHRAMGVITHGNTQVALLDTPGLIPYHEGRKLKVSKQFLTDPARSTMEADIIVVMVDAANKHTRERLDRNIVRILQANRHIPSMLVLNKVDLVSHKHVLLSVTEGLTGTMERQDKLNQVSALTRKLRNKNLTDKVRTKFESIIQKLNLELGLLDTTAKPRTEDDPTFNASTGFQGDGCVDRLSTAVRGDLCHSWPHFEETFMMSSLTGDGVESLKVYLLGHAPKGEWQYLSHEMTDTPTLDLVENIVREKLFKYLEKEIPYVITQSNILWEHTDEGTLTIYQNINCRTEKQASIVIGPAGRTIQAITREASDDIRQLLNCTVDLTLYVRSNKK